MAVIMTVSFAFPKSVYAASPPYLINFQGRLTNISGTALAGSYDMQFKLYTAASGGSPVWAETHTAANGNAVTVSNGLFNTMIGGGTVTTGVLQTVIAGNTTLYLEVMVGTETLGTRSQFGSSAYSLNSDMLDGLDSSSFAPVTGSTNYAPIAGSTNYIQNGTTQQASSNFNISGNGTIGGSGTVTGNFTNNGVALFSNTANSASAFTIQGTGSAKLFVADTSNSRIYIGNPTADSNAVLLVLDSKNTTGDPTGVQGAMYYNSADGDYRAYKGNTWGTIQPVRYVYLAGDISRAATSYADATGLSFSVEANKNYELSCSIIYRSSITTTGIGISLNGPASPVSAVGQFVSSSSATALNGRSFSAYNGGGKTTGVQTANTDTYGLFNAAFRNGANAGTLTLRYASETTSAVTIRAGTYCKLTEL